MAAPPFGTASAYSDSFPSPPPRQVTISAETCYNLSVFRDMVKQYRRLDDHIITRLNRAQAQLRDENRHPSSSSRPSSSRSWFGFEKTKQQGPVPMEGPEGMCVMMWNEMMAGWAHRQTLLSYCLQSVQSSLEAKRPGGASSPGDERLSAPAPSADGRRRGWQEEEVLANSLANEESVEAIIRKRTLDAFKSRCPFFVPPNPPSRAWYDLADSGRPGRGPDI